MAGSRRGRVERTADGWGPDACDKFLAAPDRLGSRSRAAAARERGKVFRQWRRGRAGGRPAATEGRRRDPRVGGSARQCAPPRGAVHGGTAADPLRRSIPDRARQAGGAAGGSPRAARARRSRSSIRSKITCGRTESANPSSCIGSIATRPASCCSRRTAGPTRRLKQQFRARTPERVYLAVVYGHPEPCVGHVAGLPRVGHEGADSEGNASKRSARRRGDQPVPRRRVVRVHEPHRGAADDREAEPDPHPGAPAGPHARRRGALYLRPRRASPDPIQAAGAPRLAPDLSSSRRTKGR